MLGISGSSSKAREYWEGGRYRVDFVPGPQGVSLQLGPKSSPLLGKGFSLPTPLSFYSPKDFCPSLTGSSSQPFTRRRSYPAGPVKLSSTVLVTGRLVRNWCRSPGLFILSISPERVGGLKTEAFLPAYFCRLSPFAPQCEQDVTH